MSYRAASTMLPIPLASFSPDFKASKVRNHMSLTQFAFILESILPHGFFTVKDKKSKHKVSWKLAKGWKLVFAKYSDQENWIWYDSARSFKNGKYVPNTKKGSWLQIRVKDSKGVEYKLDIHFGGNRKYY